MREQVAKVSELRRQIREADASVPDWDLRDWWDEARFELDKVRLFGDLATAAFFEGSKPKEREAKRAEYAAAVIEDGADQFRGELDERRRDDQPLAPFHWELEFPEVFEREPSAGSARGNRSQEKPPGFDAIVGNPPFAGKNSLAAGNVAGYPDWLKQLHAESHGNADLVVHFFRRAFNLVRKQGAFGLIATNTIAQGDTRASGLRWICTHGGKIFSVRRRVKWPGLAAVVVSVLHIGKGQVAERKQIDGRDVERITAFLFHRGGHDDPVRLKANAGKSFVGSYVLGMGFTFDDTDTKGVASPLSEMRWLIEKDPRNQEVIFPYIGGQEVNTSPTHAHHRYVINFSDYPLRRQRVKTGGAGVPEGSRVPADGLVEPVISWVEATDEQRRAWLQRGTVPPDYPGPVAADWPELVAIAAERVQPERARLGEGPDARRRKRNWWLWGRYTPALFRSIAGLERVLAISQVTQHIAFAFLPAGMVYAHRLYVIPDARETTFAVLQSRSHEIWARFLGSSLEDRFMYAAADCFETFPFPHGSEPTLPLEAAGRQYYEFRGRPHGPQRRRPDEGLQPVPRPVRERPRYHEASRTPRRHGPRRPRRLRLDRHPHRLRVPPRLRDRRGNVGQQEETVPLPLARRRPRRSARAAPGAERRTCRRRGPRSRPRRALVAGARCRRNPGVLLCR